MVIAAALLACQPAEPTLDTAEPYQARPGEAQTGTQSTPSDASTTTTEATPPATMDTGTTGVVDTGTASSSPSDSTGSTSASGDTGDTGQSGTSTAPSTSTPGCVTGFDIGECPPDFALPDRNAETVRLSDYPGLRVAVVGTAEW